MRLVAAAVVAIGVLSAVKASGGLQAAVGSTSTSSATRDAPLLGANLIQYEYALPYCWGRHIILDYHSSAVRDQVVPALHAMRAAGLETFRLFLYHSHTRSTASAGLSTRHPAGCKSPIAGTSSASSVTSGRRGSSAGDGDLQPLGQQRPDRHVPGRGLRPVPVRGELEFHPQGSAPLVKQYGPPSTRFDLLNEGAPNNWLNHDSWMDYVTRMYRKYVDAYGNEDVTVSAIASSMRFFGDTSDDVIRMQNLIDALRASGRPLPTWFAVHPSWMPAWSTTCAPSIRADRELDLSQPLVIDESRYNNPEVAAAIATFIDSSPRPVLEVMEWPLLVDSSQLQQQRCVTLPYQIDEYAKALRGGLPPKSPHGSVGQTGQLALRSGTAIPSTG